MKLRMNDWKKLVLRAVSFGAGFAVTSALIIGIFLWWSQRPSKPKPWNQGALTATYEALGTEGDTHTFWLAYTIENKTDSDYSLSSDSGIHLAVVLRRYNDALIFSDSKSLTTDYPLFIPAHHRVRIRMHLSYPYPEAEDFNSSEDARYDYETKAAVYLAKELNNVNGFVVMDENSRFQINLPNGWDERGKEPLRLQGRGAK
jgi:hypothetical protein